MDRMSLFPEFSNSMSKETLEVLMGDLQLTQDTLAKRLDVDRKTVSRWVHGDVPVPGAVALLLHVAHEMQKFSHSWSGFGIAAQDVPSMQVPAKMRAASR